MNKPTINDIRHIQFPVRPSPQATLSVYEAPNVPYAIARVFVVSAAENTDRGAHAHKVCQQLLVCLNGNIHVRVKDGKSETEISLNSSGKGILVPAGLWAEQSYGTGSTLMVLASHPYDETDYIRNYTDYLEYMAS